jgi:UDP-glucose 4-epimerase
MELVTGATGFIGRALVRRLSAAGLRVRCLVRPGSGVHGLELPGVEVLRGDLLDPASIQAAVRGASRVWHLGALVRADGFLTSRKGVISSFNSLNAEAVGRLAQAAGLAKVKRFVFFSSIAALGPGEHLGDKAEPRPITFYGKAKLAAEALVKRAADETGMDYIMLRPAMIYGPGPGSGTWEKLFNQIRHGWAAVPGSALNTLSICSLENLLNAALLAAERAPRGAALNVSEGAIAVKDLVLLIGELLGRKPVLLPVPITVLKVVSAALEPLLAAAGLYMPVFMGADRTRIAEACSSWSHDCGGLRALGWNPARSTREGLAAALGVKP